MKESVGGPIGDLVNYIINNKKEESNCNFFCSKCEVVYIGIIAATSKILHADSIDKEKEQLEEEWLEDFFNNIDYEREKKCCVETIIRGVRELKYSYDEYLRQIYELFAEDRKLLLNIIEFLLYVKLGDSPYEITDERFLLKCIKIFNISREEYEAVKKRVIFKPNLRISNNEQLDYYNSEKAFSNDFPEGLKKYIRKKLTEEAEQF